jgi:DsbC/DsbD-like thiol-disulfide interchange protein
MRNKTNFVLFITLVLFSSACSRSTSNSASSVSNTATSESNAGKRITSTDVVTATPQALEVAAGGSGEAIVRITVQKGYHVNANPASENYLKATELEIPTSDGVSVGFVVYPDPLTRKFEFSEKPLKVYEGDVTIKALLKAERTAKKGDRHLSGKVSIQACDEAVCYAPGKIDISIPVTVK